MKFLVLLIELYFVSIFVRSIITQGISSISVMFLFIFFALFLFTIGLCNISNAFHFLLDLFKSIAKSLKLFLIASGIVFVWNILK